MNLMLTLEDKALAKIAITLWNQEDIRNSMLKEFLLLEDSWQAVGEVVIDKSSKLPIPEKLKEKLLGFIVSVGLQILLWIDFHKKQHSFITSLPDTFIWTSLITIDNRRTAKKLLKEGNIGIYERFKLACMYCLEDEIRDLWKTVIDEKRYTAQTRSVHLVSFWSHYIEEYGKPDFESKKYESYLTPYQYAFKVSAMSGNEAATRYFFQKLAPEYKYHFINRITKDVAYALEQKSSLRGFIELQHSDVLFFLLSVMSVKQQTEVFKSHTYGALKCLLGRPWCNLLVEMAVCNLIFLSNKRYECLLQNIVDSTGYKHYLCKVFGDFWQKSPQTYRQFLIKGGGFGHLLLKLYYRKDKENINLIWKDLSISARKGLIFDQWGHLICQYLIYFEMWDSISFLIQECISSLEEIIKFKDQIKIWSTTPRFVVNFDSRPRFKFPEKCKWEKFFQLIDNCIPRYNKRKRMKDSYALYKIHCKSSQE